MRMRCYSGAKAIAKTMRQRCDSDATAVYLSSEPLYLGNWQHGEKYSNGLMMHLGGGSMTYIDGTMVVDMNGGPNCTKITVDAPIVIADDGQSFYKNPSYYHMAHVFKFLPQGTQVMPTQKVGLLERVQKN